MSSTTRHPPDAPTVQRAQPGPLAAAGADGGTLERPAIKALLHPTEPSRLTIALAAIVVVTAAFIAFLIAAGEPEGIAILVVVLALFLGSIWIGLQIHRAHLLGRYVRVHAGSVPALEEALDEVRDQLDYHGRIDVYVAAKLPQPAIVVSYLGTKMILIEGSLIGDLLAPDRRPELKFLLARFVGAFKARHMRLEIVALVISAIHEVKFVNLFLNPYYRATSYSGDQIGLACSGDLRTALRATARLMCGKDVEPAVAAAGLIDQSATVSHRVLPRLAQLFGPEPHLTNRYLNLLMFAKARHPAQWRSFLNELDDRTAAALETLTLRSPHEASAARRPDDGPAVFVEEWESDANVIGSAVIAVVAAGLFVWSRLATPGDLKLFGTAVLVVDGILVGGLILAALATLARRSPALVALTAVLAAGLAGWTGLVPALEIAVNDFIESSLSGWLDQAVAVLAAVAAFGLTASRGRLAVLMERRPTTASRSLELVAVAGAVAVIVATFLPTYGFDGQKLTFWEASPGVYDVVRVVVASVATCAALAAAAMRGRLLAWFSLLACCTAFFVAFTPFDFNEAYSLEVGWWLALAGASLAFTSALTAWLIARPSRTA